MSTSSRDRSVADRQCRRDTGALPVTAAARHVPRRRVRDPVPADGPPGDRHQVADRLRQQRPIRELQIPPRRRQHQHPVAVDELRVDADRVLEPPLLANVVLGQVVDRVDLARVPDPDRHPEIPQARARAPRRVAAQAPRSPASPACGPRSRTGSDCLGSVPSQPSRWTRFM